MKNRIGITSTIPVEIIYAAGHVPVDINNLFVTDASPAGLIRDAEVAGFPRNSCAWIKGIYGAALRYGIGSVVAVVQGDCSNTVALAERLARRGVEIIPFAYPYGGDRDALAGQFGRLMSRFGVTREGADAAKERLDRIRRKIWALDDLTWREGTVSGFENHLWQVQTSDFNGDPERFERELDAFLAVVSGRKETYGGENAARLGYIGVPPIAGDLYDTVERAGGTVVFNEVQRQFSMPFPGSGLIDQYLRYTYPYGLSGKIDDIRREIGKRRIDGIIQYSQSFCHHQIESDIFVRSLGVPVLTVECDRPASVGGREGMRIETFIRALRDAKTSAVHRREVIAVNPPAAPKLSCGIDLGSRYTKIIFMKDRSVCKELIFDTADFYRSFRPADPARGRFDMGGFGMSPDVVVATGYGRNALRLAGPCVMTEIQAHVRGASFLSGLKTFLLVDIGGQDVKVVKVADGAVRAFRVNDKCAAGTGRYLENMCRVLGVTCEELGAADGEPCALSATCAVFSETEIIDKIASGVPVATLCSAVNASAFMKFKPHILELWSGEPVLLSGGGARNASMRRLIAGETGADVRELDRCQFSGAIGCALSGGEMADGAEEGAGLTGCHDQNR